MELVFQNVCFVLQLKNLADMAYLLYARTLRFDEVTIFALSKDGSQSTHLLNSE